jgi:hypothetical protein
VKLMELGLADGGVALLCAFCERHGPSILFSTSKLGLERAKDVFDDKNDSSDAHESIKSDDLSLESRRLSMLFSPSDVKAAVCNGCKSVAVEDGFVSFAGRQFCTSSKFPEARLYAMARQVCVRSLSCERGAVVVFGDENSNGRVLSFQFQIADSQSRGFSRMYSFCVIHRDTIRWANVIQELFVQIRDGMKKAADSLFEQEQRMDGEGGSHISLRRVPKGSTVRSLEDLLSGGVPSESGKFFPSLHTSFSQLLFAMDGRKNVEVQLGDCVGSIPMSGLLSALGKDRFALLLCEIMCGSFVNVSCEAENEELAKRVWLSLSFLAPVENRLLFMSNDKEDHLQVSVVAGPKIVMRIGRECKFSKPIASKIVIEIVKIAEMKLDLASERLLIEAAKLDFAAAAITMSTNLKDAKLFDLFGLILERDAVFIEAWKHTCENL